MVILHRRSFKGRILRSKEEPIGSKEKVNKCVVTSRYDRKAVSKHDIDCEHYRA
jgi:hypothetical protein